MKFQLYLHRFLLIQTLPGAMQYLRSARRCTPVPIYEALLEQDGIHLTHTPPETIETTPVSRAFSTAKTLEFSVSTPSEELLTTWHQHRPQDVYPVLDAGRRLMGIITIDDLAFLASESSLVALTNAADLMRPPVSVRPEESLQAALEAMVTQGIREMPVTDETGQLLGLLDDGAIASVYLKTRANSSEAAAASPNVAQVLSSRPG